MSPSVLTAPDAGAPHIPVLLAEVLEALAPSAGDVMVDGTFGAGGYTTAILEAAPCRLLAIDRDPAAVPRAQALETRFGERFTFLPGCFGDMETLLAAAGVERVDGIVLDIGVSSMQLDEAHRGFSFRADGPLDMRMGGTGPDAADLVNSLDETALADILYRYGEERASRRIARAIVRARAEAPVTRTLQLAEIVRSQLPRSRDGIDPATRTFQALRIAVNDELGELERALDAAERLLAPGGRLVVVSFHSLEDRIVKQFLRQRSGQAPGGSRHQPRDPGQDRVQPAFLLGERKARSATDAEAWANPRARSARLRSAIRTDAPAGHHETSRRAEP
ncbi:16S rRNA (cytosine(1402)-N(4))-methyltransferase RsmH [Phaeovibrio sulfidiphilus]|uniref:Ribosomal RNA small subunit methyltransferase H n=1 Tax=Phaeovibrio sulfidiphilus TaxID=1220600 RepID=A0A8J6YPA3_9PROT|nr:16S rRNA (cytosine(1402)-N(4))-methyltransferase RsmH [Phaeovibrio sulfidiphilus]MBE1237509.1 16S rRNA (cytosine(1402)-N(4))-methyltransferase RsmH [Phaeovibrio sulfidiphilus]